MTRPGPKQKLKPIKCANCGKEFTPRKSVIKNCSAKCANTQSNKYKLGGAPKPVRGEGNEWWRTFGVTQL